MNSEMNCTEHYYLYYANVNPDGAEIFQRRNALEIDITGMLLLCRHGRKILKIL